MNWMRGLPIVTTLLLLNSLPLVLAHGHDALHGSGTPEAGVVDDSGAHDSLAMSDTGTKPALPGYFHHPDHVSMIHAHIGLTVLAWVVILPPAVMLSIGRSRFSLLVQLVFHAFNALGIVTSVIYNIQTPELYENNSHHKAGWAISFILVAWTSMSIFHLYAVRDSSPTAQAVSHEAMAEYQKIHQRDRHGSHRWSHDSGQGTERGTESLCTSPRANSWQENIGNVTKPYTDDDDDFAESGALLRSDKRGAIRESKMDRLLARTISRIGSGRHMTVLAVVYTVIERFTALLAFLLLTTGVVTYSGIFRGIHVLGGLAHFVKGGIFFWYGLLTFGRWMGCFSEFGWAWNIKPEASIVGRARARIPSAEFTESFVICLYGASNVFLEHLTGWGGAWTAMDLEHVSITLMFFGGGLLGMLIESTDIRQLMNSTFICGKDRTEAYSPAWQAPKSYVHSLNPMPALVIMLLGTMMSSHHQHSVISGIIHKQWGMMFVGFAIARGITYITLWLQPPESYLPARPPSEIIASFCLVSGGIIFMASNGDTVDALEYYGLDGMFVFTIVMGLTSVIMAWALGLVAIKGWAVQRCLERARVRMPTSSA